MLYNTQPATTAAQHKSSKNTHTMIPPGRWLLPDAPSLKVSTINLHQAMAHDLHNMVMQFVYMKLTYSLFYLYLFYRQQISMLADNRYVFSEYLPFFLGRYIESTRTDPSYPPNFFLLMPPMSSSCFGMILDEGRAAPW
jgi:hypothetical protein